jgi:hypothetical protein
MRKGRGNGREVKIILEMEAEVLAAPSDQGFIGGDKAAVEVLGVYAL